MKHEENAVDTQSACGTRCNERKIIDCVTAFQQAGYDVTIYITQGAQDATRVARERAGEFDRICVCRR